MMPSELSKAIGAQPMEVTSPRPEVTDPMVSQGKGDMDEEAADDGMMEFCKPLEFYNILKHRFSQLPFFLPRSLSYKIEAARQKRTKLTVSATACLDVTGNLPKLVVKDGAGQLEAVSVHVMLTCPLPSATGDALFSSGELRVLKAPLVRSWPIENSGFRDTATFACHKLPLRAKKEGAVILFLILLESTSTWAGTSNQANSLVNCSGRVLWAKLSMASLCSSWSNCGKGSPSAGKEKSLGTTYQVDLQNALLQRGDSGGLPGIKLSAVRGVSIKNGVQLQICISGLDGTAENGQAHAATAGSVCSSFPLSNPRPNPRVVFQFEYSKFHILQQIQEIDMFSCPICLVSCCSYKGLQYHLNSCHDFFNFEYVSYENSFVIRVSIRDGVLGDQGVNWNMVGQGMDTQAKAFCFVSKRGSRSKRQVASKKRGESYQQDCPTLQSETRPLSDERILDEASSKPLLGEDIVLGPVMDKFATMHVDHQENETAELGIHFIEPSPSVASSLEPQKLPLASHQEEIIPSSFPAMQRAVRAMLTEPMDQGTDDTAGFVASAAVVDDQELSRSPVSQVTDKSRKAALERLEARNRAALTKQQFFHSHTAQPMSVEEVQSDKDSEGDVDEEIAAIEDRRLLNEFVDVQSDEKELMHMWNCFMRKQRVIADGHCPWACEAFAKFHAPDFAKKPSLRWCMLMLLIKLWNHQLVDGSAIDACLRMIDNSIEAVAA